MPPDFVGVVASWRHPDRSRLVLCRDGTLRRARAKRQYVVVGTSASRDEAARLATAWGFRPVRQGGVGRPIRGPKRELGAPTAAERQRQRAKGLVYAATRSTVPPGYEAYHEARILAEQARVQADLARLGASA